ncbi:MAG: hypothetical protein IPI50_01885 [Saprospiraceae bacterium]|nr:hypothetical protein [Saprospiraceae bacterium]
MTKNNLIVFLVCLFCIKSIGQECRGAPQFIAALGFDPNRSAISTTELKVMGAVLIELEDVRNTNSRRTKTYQDPSWKSAGYLGAVTSDQKGNIFVIPKPNVNMLYNLPKDQNTIYRIESKSGKMKSFVKLPMKILPHERNPYGLTGSFLDCQNNDLIVSTLAGSDQKHEIGKIYAISSLTAEYFEILENLDVLGLGIMNIRGERKLFLGLARKSEVWSILLDAKNLAIGKPKLEINLSGLGPRGDDRIRKIRFQQNGSMDLTGITFYYNLTAPVNAAETVYNFSFNESTNSWKLTGLR